MNERPLGVAATAQAHPDRIALVAGPARITFAELDASMNRWARLLASRGVTRDGRVAVALRNRPAFFEAVGGAARLGAEVVPVPWRAKLDEVRYLVSDSGAAILVCEPGAEAADLPVLVADSSLDVDAFDDSPIGEDDPVAFRYYTSGTTGRPKAIDRPRPDPASAREFIAWYLGMYGTDRDDDVHLLCGPLYHTAPVAFSGYALTLGQTVVVMERFDAGSCLSLIEEHRVTWSHMVPINFVRILALPPAVLAGADLSSVRRILHAAAPCPVDVKRRIMDVFPPGAVWEYYGMTEGLATIISPGEWLAHPGSVGRAAPGLTLSIRDVRGDELKAGETGLVYVTPMGGVRFAYAGAPEKTDATWRDEQFTVGDMGYLDDEGYLYLTDRATDMIISGGANVYPAEVEAVLYEHPAVGDVAVIGIPDDEWGEAVHAVVEPRTPVSPADLIAFCRDNLAHYKCPRTVELVSHLPRDESGKLRKRDLRDRYWTGRERRI